MYKLFLFVGFCICFFELNGQYNIGCKTELQQECDLQDYYGVDEGYNHYQTITDGNNPFGTSWKDAEFKLSINPCNDNGANRFFIDFALGSRDNDNTLFIDQTVLYILYIQYRIYDQNGVALFDEKTIQLDEELPEYEWLEDLSSLGYHGKFKVEIKVRFKKRENSNANGTHDAFFGSYFHVYKNQNELIVTPNSFNNFSFAMESSNTPLLNINNDYHIDYGDGTSYALPQSININTSGWPPSAYIEHEYHSGTSLGNHTYTNIGIYTVVFSGPSCINYPYTITIPDPCGYITMPSAYETFNNELPSCYYRTSTFDESLFSGLQITNISVDFGETRTDGQSSVRNNLNENQLINYTYQNAGDHTITQTIYFDDGHGFLKTCVTSIDFEVSEPDVCCSNFAPEIGKTYWLSAWVKKESTTPLQTYNGQIDLLFYDQFTDAVTTKSFFSSGEIVDGWQRIVGKFIIPSNTKDIEISLKNSSSANFYFDDVRIHPFDASMKSFVYDPYSLKLMAELDDNNFATFYEYDNEGQLIRIKKETARGIMTIEEKRSSNSKIQQ